MVNLSGIPTSTTYPQKEETTMQKSLKYLLYTGFT